MQLLDCTEADGPRLKMPDRDELAGLLNVASSQEEKRSIIELPFICKDWSNILSSIPQN